MWYQCSCGGTIQIETKFFTYLSDAEIAHRCMDKRLRDCGDPFTGSYLETGDRDIPDEVEDEEEDYDSDHIKDVDWEMLGIDKEGYMES